METDPSCRLLPSSSSAPRLHPWQPSVEVDKKIIKIPQRSRSQKHTSTHIPIKTRPLASPHQLSPFSDLKEHLLIGKRALFKNTTDATYTTHTRTDPVCTKTLGCINNDEQHFKKKRRRHAETRGGEKGEEFCGKPKQPTRMLAGLYLFAFYYNVLSL